MQNQHLSTTAPAPDKTLMAISELTSLIQLLEGASGRGTTLVSIFVPASHPITRPAKLLSSATRKAVQEALRSAQAKLKLYKQVPPNGLAIFCGNIKEPGTDKTKLLSLDYALPAPSTAAVYHCSSTFDTQPLHDVLVKLQQQGKKDAWAFLVVDGQGAVFGLLMGSERVVVKRMSVSLPNKHGRGGQSANRFERLRDAARNEYIKRVAETAVEVYCKDGQPNIGALILAGPGDLKSDLAKSDHLRPLKPKLVRTVDCAYGGNAGFAQAVSLCVDLMQGSVYVAEEKVLTTFFHGVGSGSGKYCYGAAECVKYLESGIVDRIFLWQDLNLIRTVHSDTTGQVTYITYDPPTPESTGTPLQTYIHTIAKTMGTTIRLITGNTPLGAQFVRGFGGVGAVLRYAVDVEVDEFESESDGEGSGV
ncbi:Electron transfer flavoprotein alpha-subunit [Borealophlyctis nickersoniae]|nr:Electron transfer flavoprotein alpha-subunit [Borealophlyctis nickersoniae]